MMHHFALFFGGFRQDSINDNSSAFSTWIRAIANEGTLENCVLNMWMDEDDSLLDRWRRADGTLASLLLSKEIKVHLLGYSMGCHLAVKFASELAKIKTGRISFGEVFLIAPDPKYIENDLNDLDLAYEEAKAFWNTNAVPGVEFSSILRTLPQELSTKVYVIYSELDTVARWEGNVKRLKTECEKSDVSWYEIKFRNAHFTNESSFCLEPQEAQSEFWVHTQLFTKCRIPFPN